MMPTSAPKLDELLHPEPQPLPLFVLAVVCCFVPMRPSPHLSHLVLSPSLPYPCSPCAPAAALRAHAVSPTLLLLSSRYDDSGFAYFSLSLLTLYLAPASFRVLRSLYAALKGQHASEVRSLKPRSSAERAKMDKLAAEASDIRKLLTSYGFLFSLGTLVVGWYVWYLLFTSMTGELTIAQFDPYAILGIDSGLEDKEIKRAYRSLSLKYHPDKNPGNKMAEDMFMKIAKAYEALTDPVSKANWEKYGNPDGKQPMEVSIALPTFLLNKEWHNTILIFYLIVMVVVVPSIVAMWYARSKKYGEKNVMYDSYTWYNHSLSEQAPLRIMPEVLAGSAEFRTLNAPKKEEMPYFKSLFKKLHGEIGVMPKPRYDHPMLIKGTTLLFSHLIRKPVAPEHEHALRMMLTKTTDLVEAMIDLTCSRRWLRTTQAVIEFSQYLVQGLWVKDNSLLQLPHLGEGEVKAITAGKGGVKDLSSYLQVPDEEKKGLNRLSATEKEEVLAAARSIPDLDVEVSCFVDDEDQIAEGDLVTIKVTLTRKNVPEGGKASPVYAPFFPIAREEAWWILVGNARTNAIFASERITDQGRTAVKEVKMMAPPNAGTVQLDVFVKSDCYIGLDITKDVKFEVVPASTLAAYEAHPDDLELDNEPTLFEQVMQGYDDSDSDEEADAADGEGNKVNGKANKGDDEEYESDSSEEDD
ncbi:unnamed protein product [Chrysoparadoxa australica]